MAFKNNINATLILTIVFFTSCKDHNEYRVGSEFSEYLHRFEKQAGDRGKTFNLEAEGLIIEFANLKNNTAGLTHYEDPIRVEIDKSYWDDISKFAGADLMKENLIFHELGHGLLNRRHLNNTLENGDWKSIMCGGENDENREWNINYRGERRAYYLDELFDESTPTPDFASTQLLVDTSGFKSSFILNFNSPTMAEAGWDIKNNSNYSTSISNGRLKFESKSELIYLITAKISINTVNDFSYELTLEYPTSTDPASQYGLIFGTIPDSTSAPSVKESLEYFTINNNQKMNMGNRTWYSFFTELHKNQITTSGANTLKIIKLNGMLYYFINNIYSYRSEIEATDDGFHFGFWVPAKGTVYLENLIISTLATAKISSRTKKLQTVEFKITAATPFNNHSIPNK